MADTNIPKDVASSFTSIFTNINFERLSEIAVALILCLIGFVIARLVSNTFIRTIGSRFNAHQRLLWRRGIFYFIFLLFIMTSLREAGFKLSVFLGAAGILTVALGFASQTSATNLISGLFLIGEGSFEVGDTIQITLIRGQTIEGEVISIDLLSVKLLTLDNVYIRLPNEQLIRTPVMNLSKYPIRRIPITLAINFHEDIIKVRQVLLDVASKYPLVMDDPKPTVTVTAFRESSIELLFAVWCRQENALKVRDEMQERVRNGFLENEIEIPVPKMGLIDRPIPLEDDEVDQYAHQKELKKENKVR
ncbi:MULTISPECIES: mechanosensitive ion channel family protein [Acinetobacter]|jgi:small-conductance mechanosensitive channel|uniref:Small-conductance mechanosensitive channel n=2 Tax=Acinetobacter junii TaxID=40215 RepID=A0A2R4URV2_ACIJU|nr:MULTISPECIES: mechanosensitive ion channel family protein [Acinetobacter]AWA48774.1 mechanosensitive ion channel family protein [Acinetobacter junii]EEY91976.1 transporter, small conductance mechanosensitive ion channel MscS family protein [Acinetobacter junii SH205]MBL8281486.1 mechanosensitive ion channel family protein [Acinetobacter junii]MCU4406760.1 mechanosensitive ion channel family protein [Acinetobacter junii]MDH0717781.1 mechanosensitive ion channel family protein [Acinetobacter 